MLLHPGVQHDEVLATRVDGRVDREIAHFNLPARGAQFPLIWQLDKPVRQHAGKDPPWGTVGFARGCCGRVVPRLAGIEARDQCNARADTKEKRE
jgi:hypothetical protein